MEDTFIWLSDLDAATQTLIWQLLFISAYPHGAALSGKPQGTTKKCKRSCPWFEKVSN